MSDIQFYDTEIGKIPYDWTVKKLGELTIKIFCGRDPSGGKMSHSKEQTKHRMIRSGNVFDDHLEIADTGYISEELARTMSSAEVFEDDVLLNQLGDGITFARSCVVKKEVLPAYVTRSVGVIRVDIERLNPNFLNAYLTLRTTKNYIESFNSGSSRRAIDGSKMRQFLIPIPSMKEQKKIGDMHINILEKIELNHQMNSMLEKIGQTIFKHWFVDFEFPNKEGKPYKSSGGEMVDSERGEIPKGWRIGLFTEIADIKYGFPFKSKLFNSEKKGTPIIRIRDLPDNFTDTYTDEGFNKDFLVKPGDLLVGMDGEFKPYIWQGIPSLLNQRICSISGKGNIYSKHFLRFLLIKPLELIESGTVGTTVIHLSKRDFDNLKIIIPSENILNFYNSIFNFMHEKRINNSLENLNLSQIHDSLLPKLMSGKIRVNVLEKDAGAIA